MSQVWEAYQSIFRESSVLRIPFVIYYLDYISDFLNRRRTVPTAQDIFHGHLVDEVNADPL